MHWEEASKLYITRTRQVMPCICTHEHAHKDLPTIYMPVSPHMPLPPPYVLKSLAARVSTRRHAPPVVLKPSMDLRHLLIDLQPPGKMPPLRFHPLF